MSRSLPSTRSALTSIFLITVGSAAACGHSSETWDAFKNAKITGGSSTPPPTDGTAGTGSTGTQFACTTVTSQQFDSSYMKAYSIPADVQKDIDSTFNLMGPGDKAAQMIGIPPSGDYQDIERSPDVTVTGVGTIRGYNYRDAGRGVNLDAGQKNRADDGNNFSTVFPVASARAASWDLDLEKRIGEAAGDETAASMNNMLLAPCMNIIRHPYWGRTQETYSEDSYHIGRMATAYTVGLQEYVTGCAKHFAGNNIEKGRSTQNALIDEQTLREIYSRHFEMVVQDGGIGCIMASYNKINGVKNTQNKHLLQDILKAPIEQGGMGYQGLVITDWWAMPGDQTAPDASTAQSVTNEAVLAGLDIEVPWTLHYSQATLAAADQNAVNDSAKRVLTQKYRFKTATTNDGWSAKAPTSQLSASSIMSNPDHEALAEEAELKSAVLLQNGAAGMPVLPLKGVTSVAVVGPDEDIALGSSSVPKDCVQTTDKKHCTFHFATEAALGDRGSSRVNGDPAKTVGPFLGIQNAAGSGITVTSGNSATAAANADAVVVVVGYTPSDEGEEYAITTGGDRSSLDLPPGQNDFVNSVLALGKPTVIIIESGSIVNLPWLTNANKNQATIWAGYGGLRGGAALGKLIFAAGGANFSGKMPMAWPTQTELDVAKFKDTDGDGNTRMGYFFGYREYDRRKAAGMNPALVFPFGQGISYSTFEYSNLTMPCATPTKDAVFNVSVDIANTSAVDGDEIAMLFVKPPPKPAGEFGQRPVKELKSFARVSVKAGTKVTAQLPLRMRDFRRWAATAADTDPIDPVNPVTTGNWVIDSGTYTILVGKNADDAEASTNTATFTIN